MTDHDIQGSAKISANGASKYMTFKLAKEEYGIEILKVRELIGLLEITRVPRTKPYIRGLVNLRGKVIPVVDLRTKFGMPATESTSQTVIIVVQIASGPNSLTMGVALYSAALNKPTALTAKAALANAKAAFLSQHERCSKRA